MRHIPSGRYLCVDTSAPFHEDQGMGTNGEKWYRVCLVDDAALEEDELLQPQLSGNDDLAAVGDAMQSNSVVLYEGFKAVQIMSRESFFHSFRRLACDRSSKTRAPCATFVRNNLQ